ncbi:MAG: 3-deoxy-D-manno-octulosonic acid transferase [Planctomycetota bacterium]
MPSNEAAFPAESPHDPGPPEGVGTGASLGFDLLYATAAILGAPLLCYRRWVLKKDLHGGAQKRGHLPDRPAHVQRIWIHAVSVGEAKATHVLYKALKSELPGVEIVFSTTTDTGQEVARKLYGEASVFYYPLDFSRCVRRALDRTKPALVVLMELEVWPNFTAECAARGIPIVVLNARITERSARRYARGWWLLGRSFLRVRRWLAQSDEYAGRLRELGVDASRIEVAGNIKYDDVDTAPPPAEARQALRRAMGLAQNAQVWIGGSTHPSEEAALLGVYRLLREKHPRLRLILCPRHPHRLPEVEREIASHGLAVLKRSILKAQGLSALDGMPAERLDSAVILVDTMGELKQLYTAADLAFVGGSLIPHGGQSVMEPAGLGLACVYGPYMQNFAEAVLLLKEADGARMVDDAEGLRETLEKLLADPEAAHALGVRAREALLKKQGATARCVEYLKTLLK